MGIRNFMAPNPTKMKEFYTLRPDCHDQSADWSRNDKFFDKLKPVYTGFLFIRGELKKAHRLFYPNSRR